MMLLLLIIGSLVPVPGCRHERTFTASSVKNHENKIVLENISRSFVGLDSVVKCYLQCLIDEPCQSFFYRLSDGFCQLNTRTFSEMSKWQSLKGTKHYQITTGWCPTSNGYLYHKVTNMCYKLSLAIKIWSEAREACKEDGGDLIILDTDQKYDHIVDFIRSLNGLTESETDFMVGANDEQKEGAWFWVDGKVLLKNSTMWAEGEPNDQLNQQDYAILSPRLMLKLDDGYDWRESYYFCEIRPQ